MKALQSLIPNSNKVMILYIERDIYMNHSIFCRFFLCLIIAMCLLGKTDKASMLDEAIEYLKQLQLQVQVTKDTLCLSL